MTDLLRDTLAERAGVAPSRGLDLDAIITTGNRRIRRRQAGRVVGTAVVALAVIAGGLSIARQFGDEPQIAGGEALPFSERRPAYAIRDQLHYGKETFSIGKGELVNQYIQTDAGFVYASMPKGDGGLDGKPAADGSDSKRSFISVIDRAGRRTIGGKVGRGDLVADHRGTLVGWTEQSVKQPGKTGDTVVYDVAARREIVRVDVGQPIPGVSGSPKVGALQAIDGGMAYWMAEKGVYRVELATKKGELIPWTGIPAKLRLYSGLRSVSQGKLLYQVPNSDGKTSKLVFGPDLAPASGRILDPLFQGGRANLSPDAGHAVVTQSLGSSTADTDIRLFSTASGKKLTLRADGYQRQRFAQWLNNETFTTVGIKAEQEPLDLLRCSTRTLRCETLISRVALSPMVDPVENPEKFTFPVGYRVG